jgi:ribosomal protein S18 acetylase RimI-like enzyme
MIGVLHRISAADVSLLARAAGRSGAGVAGVVAAPGAVAVVAEHDDVVQGWCWGHLMARPDGDRMLYLHHLEVVEQHRRRGVGRALVREFMAAGVEQGATRMFLVTGEHNTAARRLYESLGAGLAAQGPTVSYWFMMS